MLAKLGMSSRHVSIVIILFSIYRYIFQVCQIFVIKGAISGHLLIKICDVCVFSAPHSSTMCLVSVMLHGIFGLSLWSFFEYVIHRWIFHLPPPPTSKFLITAHFLLHGQHHKVCRICQISTSSLRITLKFLLYTPKSSDASFQEILGIGR